VLQHRFNSTRIAGAAIENRPQDAICVDGLCVSREIYGDVIARVFIGARESLNRGVIEKRARLVRRHREEQLLEPHQKVRGGG